MTREYEICTRCVMDTTDPEITFDDDGICNHCTNYLELLDKHILPEPERTASLKRLISKIQEKGKNKEYDAILGVSGGVDSTYMAFKAKELGLRPLAVHLDNGWNSKLAVSNIERVLKRIDVDLYTHVIDWEEFKDLQLAYFKASVVDIEAITDHAIVAEIYNTAVRHSVKYIISGYNLATEGILPKSWVWNKMDAVNIRDIHRRFGTKKLETFPLMGFPKYAYLRKIRGYKSIQLLNYLDYNRVKAKQFLIDDFGWEDYGGKHHESLFTKFYQAYVLPRKFNIDKRKAHLSTLILSGQITREDALKTLKKPLYDERDLKRDKEYVLKKFGLTENEWGALMALPIRQHDEFKTDQRVRRLLLMFRS
ncbi:MAG: N-acetyl sugar amidotransferase [Candidatus Hermodarchaeota archaeon]